MITREQVYEYKQSGGKRCLACLAEDSLEYGPIKKEEAFAFQDIRCDNCGFEWTNVYKLVDVLISDLSMDEYEEAMNQKRRIAC